MRLLYILMPVIGLSVISFYIWTQVSKKPLQLSPSDIVVTQILPNVVSLAPGKPTTMITDELGYAKTDAEAPVDVYYPFNNQVQPVASVDELGLERAVISAPLTGLDTTGYTLLHLPTPEQVTFDTGQVLNGQIQYVESTMKDEKLYVSFYRGAIRDYEDPVSKIRQEMQRIKLVRNGFEIKKSTLFTPQSVETARNEYYVVKLSPDQNDITVVLNKKFDRSFTAYEIDDSWITTLPTPVMKVLLPLMGIKNGSEVKVNTEFQGWEIRDNTAAGKWVLLIPS